MSVGVRFQFRRDTSTVWTANNPILVDGEPGFETDTGKIKFGVAATPWNSLSYFSPTSVGSTNPPFEGIWSLFSGNAVVGHNVSKPGFYVPRPFTLRRAVLYTSTGNAPTGTNLKLSVRKRSSSYGGASTPAEFGTRQKTLVDTSTAPTFNLVPGSNVVGKLGVIIAIFKNQVTSTVLSGWTSIVDEMGITSDIGYGRLVVWVRNMTATDTLTGIVFPTLSGSPDVGIIESFAIDNLTATLDGSLGAKQTGFVAANTPVTLNTVTTTVDRSWVIAVTAGIGNVVGDSTWVGLSEALDTSYTNGASVAALTVAMGIKSTAGVVSGVTFANAQPNNWHLRVFALKATLGSSPDADVATIELPTTQEVVEVNTSTNAQGAVGSGSGLPYALVKGDILQTDINQIGSTNPGADLALGLFESLT